MAKSPVVTLRVKPEVLGRWQKSAAAAGMTLSAWMVGQIEGKGLGPETVPILTNRVFDEKATVGPGKKPNAAVRLCKRCERLGVAACPFCKTKEAGR